jgi:hypothetical protein
VNYILKWIFYVCVDVQKIYLRTPMIEGLEGIWKETAIAYREICLELRKSTNAFSQDNW